MKQKKQDSTTSGQLFSKKKLNFGVRLVKTFHFYMNFTNYSFTYINIIPVFSVLIVYFCNVVFFSKLLLITHQVQTFTESSTKHVKHKWKKVESPNLFRLIC